MERRALVPALAVFGLSLAAAAWGAIHVVRLDLEAHRRAATELARGPALALEQSLAQSLVSATALGAVVAGGGSDAQLARLANELLLLDAGTASLQLAPDGVISRIWPLAGNEAAMGLDLLRHAVHGPYVRTVRETRRPLLYGPFDLVQGGRGLALRTPVFVPDGPGERFWGVSSAVIRLDALLEASRAPRLVAAGFDYELTRSDGPEGLREVLARSRSSGPDFEAPVTVPVQLPGQAWTLAIAPRMGWRGTASPVLLGLLVVLVAVLGGVLAYRVASEPVLLRRQVQARTLELEAAHREQRRAEEAQRQSQKLEAIGLLAGGVAHDFNNLLVGILGYADMLAADAAAGSTVAEAAQVITVAAQRAAELTRQLLTFARLGDHRAVEVDLHDLVSEVSRLLRRTLDKAIRMELNLVAPHHRVRGDPGHLQQVVLNLAVNARDAMPAGGTLTIGTEVAEVDEAAAAGPRGGSLPGPLRDRHRRGHPAGEPRADLRAVLHDQVRRAGDGPGARHRPRHRRGSRRHGPGLQRGGRRFPVHHLPAAAGGWWGAAAPGRGAPARGAGVVLVVDDEEMVRQTAGRMLSNLGYQPALVAGGPEALAWLRACQAPPVAVILDLAMPGMDGRTCFREMRALHPDLRVVISSGFARDGRAQGLLDQGAREFVPKPYRTSDLARALARASGAVAG